MRKTSYGNDRVELFDEEGIDLQKYFNLFKKNWLWFLLSAIVGCLIAFAINFYSVPVYQIETKIILDENEDESVLSNAGNIMSGINFSAKNRISNEIEILKSYTLNKKAIDELDFDVSYFQAIKHSGTISLYNHSPFVIETDSTQNNITDYPVYIKIISDKKYIIESDDKISFNGELDFDKAYNSENFNFTIRLTPFFNSNKHIDKLFFFKINNRNMLANYYREKVEISINDEAGSVLTLTSKGEVPQKEVDFLNKLIENYIEYGLELKNKNAVNTVSFIDEQLSIINDSLFVTEDRLQNFRAQNKIIDLSKKGSILYDQLVSLQTEQSKSILKKNYLIYLEKYIEESKELDHIIAPSAMGVDDQLLTYLITELKARFEEKKSKTYGIIEQGTINDLYNSKINTLKVALLDNISSNIKNVNMTLSGLEEQITTLNKSIRKLPANERKMISIERNFNVNNSIYNFLLEKRAEAGIAKASNISDNRVLDPAIVENSRPISPKKRMNLIIGLIIGILIPLIVIILKDTFSNIIRDVNSITERLDYPIIARIKHNNYKNENPLKEHPNSLISETFRTFRTNMRFLIPEGQCNVISITSAASGEGKTFCTLNLATILAMNSNKVLLINMDLRKSCNFNSFNVSNLTGISTYLIGESTQDEIIKKSNIENLWISPPGPTPPNPVELISKNKLNDFILYCRNHFDYVIIDTPPIGIVSEGLLINNLCDYVFFIIRINQTHGNAIDLLNDLVLQKVMKSVYLIINDVKVMHYVGRNYGNYFYNGYYSNAGVTNKNIFNKMKNHEVVKKIFDTIGINN